MELEFEPMWAQCPPGIDAPVPGLFELGVPDEAALELAAELTDVLDVDPLDGVPDEPALDAPDEPVVAAGVWAAEDAVAKPTVVPTPASAPVRTTPAMIFLVLSFTCLRPRFLSCRIGTSRSCAAQLGIPCETGQTRIRKRRPIR
ncbi:MAG: hypothetical protein ACRDVW_00910 [Acidimicrobiales bacterium]